MDDLSDVRIVPMVDSKFVNPLRMLFKQNTKEHLWDLVTVHESVSIIIFNTTKKALVFVKQFRPAIYYNSIPRKDAVDSIDVSKYPASIGFTLELCAGIVDKDKSLAEVAAEEVLEECGYKVHPDNLEHIVQFHSGVGLSGDQQTLFFVEVTDDMKVNPGGGSPEEGEFIEVIYMNISEAENYIKQKHVKSPGGFLFAVQWFLSNKAKLYG